MVDKHHNICFLTLWYFKFLCYACSVTSVWFRVTKGFLKSMTFNVAIVHGKQLSWGLQLMDL